MSSELSAQDLAIKSTEFKSLRDRKGHFNGGDHDADVDGYGGKKRKIMEALAETLGKKGATASKILEAMGPPDEIVPKVGATNVGPLEAAGPGAIIGGMPGPVISGDGPNASVAGTGKPYFLVYHWRGRHDYLYFEVDPSGETVEGYGWYAAGA